MSIKNSPARRVFVVVNTIVLTAVGILCVLPILNVLAISFSSSAAANANQVLFWPVDFNTLSYEYVMEHAEFGRAFLISVVRVLIGLPINMALMVMTAYPLSKSKEAFPIRNGAAWFFIFAMLFSVSLVPQYMVIRSMGLLDTIWAMILPGALPIFNMVLVMNFFRSLPKEIEESAFIDGAGYWTSLIKIYLPLSLPSLATVALFTIVGHWNSWFDGMIFMNNTANYPLQSYLQTVVVRYDTETLSKMTLEELEQINKVSNRTTQCAQIFIAALPILCVYPFLQKYFVKGLVMGSVKG